MIQFKEYGKRPITAKFEACEFSGGIWRPMYGWSFPTDGGGSPAEDVEYTDPEECIRAAARSFLSRFKDNPKFSRHCAWAKECIGTDEQTDLFGGL